MKPFCFFLLFVSSILVDASTSTPDAANSPAPSKPTPQIQPATNSIRDYLEMASFCATIATAIVAFLALRQLHLAKLQIAIATNALEIAKDDIKVRSQREAVALAANRCEDLANVKFPLISASFQMVAQQGIRTPRWALKNKLFDESSLKEPAAAESWLNQIRSKNLNLETVKLLNQLEAFAIFFANGAADEEVAFPVAGIPFCDYVEWFAPTLIAARTKKLAGVTSGKYPNTVRLYEIWADRIRVEEIEGQAKVAQKELDSLKKEKIKPIGVK